MTTIDPSSRHSERFRPFTRALVLAVVAVLAIDGAVRAFEARLSGDVANKLSFGQVMHEATSQSWQPFAVAVGSSLVDRGIDPTVLARVLSSTDNPAGIVKLAPDNSTVWDWTCVIERHVLTARRLPDVVVIGFAWDQLSDNAPFQLRRNFNHQCPVSQLSVYGEIAPAVGVETWLKVSALAVSKLYTHQEPIHQLLFRHIVPHYAEVAQALNEREAPRAAEAANVADRAESVFHYKAAARVLDELQAQGTRAVLAAMPVQEPYALDPALCALVADSPHRLLDLRTAIPAAPSLYRDPIHLNEEGARLFSEVLGAAMMASRTSPAPCPA
jgi:hypothetical protein